MKKLIVILLSLLLYSCCNTPAPDKLANLSVASLRDTSFVRNIKKIYALGSVSPSKNPYIQGQTTQTFDSKYGISFLNLPISYATDSTAYIFEQKNKANDTLIVYYKRNVSYDGGGNCGYQTTLSSVSKQNYSSFKKASVDISFGTYGKNLGPLSGSITQSACRISIIIN